MTSYGSFVPSVPIFSLPLLSLVAAEIKSFWLAPGPKPDPSLASCSGFVELYRASHHRSPLKFDPFH